MSAPNPNAKRPAKIFTQDQVVAALQAQGIPCQIEGRQINADLAGTGHHHIKITPAKGVYLDVYSGKGGTIAQFLLGIGASAPTGAQAPAHPAVGGHNPGSTTIHDAQRIWGSGWICTHAGDMPAGWDKGLNSSQKGARRAKIEQHRDTVRAYLESRLGPDHLDHWIRQIRIAPDGLMLTPMQKNGAITGIQRTHLDQDGRKTERKMLGPQGITFCPAPSTVNPNDLGIGAVTLIGEGWETVASVAQAVGWPGISCHFDGGMVKWAREQVEKLSPEQHVKAKAKAPAAVFLVDRDQSGAGQKASARAINILRTAGLKAFFAIPPSHAYGGPKGGEKGSDWGDYPKESIRNEVLVAHLALAVAHGDQDMPESDEDPGIFFRKPDHACAWRLAQNPQEPAQAGPTHEVRADLQTALQQTVNQYLDWMDDKDKPFAPVLMMPTTGTGKSTAAKSLIRHVELRQGGVRVCVFVPDHLQAQEYEHEGFFHFYGRNPEPDHPGYCPAHETIEEAQKTGHISQAEVCKQCSNGYRWAIDYYSESNDAQFKDKIADAKAKLAARGLKWEKVTPCEWQRHLRHALDAQFVVAASGSYSHSLTRDSLVIFDEHFEPGKGVNVTLQDVDHWARRNQGIIDHLEKHNGDPEAFASHQQAGEFFRAVALAMAQFVGKTGAISVDHVLLGAIKGILEAARASATAASATATDDDVALAAWETLRFNAAGEMSDNPLRAAHAIAESLKYGDGFVNDGELVVASSLPVMERLASGRPTVIMDATPDPVIDDVVRAQGGRVVNSIAHQNVRVRRYPTRFWGITPLNSKRAGAERVEREVMKYTKLIDHHHRDYGETAFLFHKKAFDALDLSNHRLGAEGDAVAYASFPHIRLGDFDYWGRGHRAHNRWKSKELVIVGSFFPPLEAWRAMYQVSRIAALSAGANSDHWPAWPDDMEMVKDEWICEGDHEVQCRLPLPSDSRIREWLLNRVTAETVQAVGRARGANAENTIDIHIYGGVPLHGLWRHGLPVAEYADDPACLGQTKAEHMQDMREMRAGSIGRCDMLAARVISKGQTVTRRAMEAEVDAINALLDDARDGADGDESYLWGGGIYIHSTPPQIQMPDTAVIRTWIATRMPVLSQHLSTKGRDGGLVKAAQSAARRFGEEMLLDAMEIAETLAKAGGDMAKTAWDIIERDGSATDLRIVGARLALEGVGETEDTALPWCDEAAAGEREVMP